MSDNEDDKHTVNDDDSDKEKDKSSDEEDDENEEDKSSEEEEDEVEIITEGKPPITNDPELEDTMSDNEVGDVDSDDDSSDEEYNPFKISVPNEYLIDSHPESKHLNYEEIYVLSKVVRDSEGYIVDDLHRTLPVLSKYERTRVIGQRATHLERGNPSFIQGGKNNIDSSLLAEEELKHKLIPMIIRRPFPNGRSEYWKVSDLEILNN
jgi:DNA-directed RNA polymerase subunit K/omega